MLHHELWGTKYSELWGCAFNTCLYVGLLYLWRGLPRDAPSTIKKRCASVLLASALSWIPLALHHPAHHSVSSQPLSLPQLLGLAPRAPWRAALIPLALTAVLFACPIALELMEEGSNMFLPDSFHAWAASVLAAVKSCDLTRILCLLAAPFADEHLWLWRNLLVAPLCEEWVFRSCMASLLRVCGYSLASTVLITPLFFGVAHVHHLHDLVCYQGFPVGHALTAVCFQALYTCIFGLYETYLFLRTQSLAGPVLVHMFCNRMGLPKFVTMAKAWGMPVFLTALLSSIAAFAALLGPATSPRLYE